MKKNRASGAKRIKVNDDRKRTSVSQLVSAGLLKEGDEISACGFSATIGEKGILCDGIYYNSPSKWIMDKLKGAKRISESSNVSGWKKASVVRTKEPLHSYKEAYERQLSKTQENPKE